MNGRSFLLPLARLLMSSLFIWDGIVMLRNPRGTAQYFASVHVPAPDVAVWLAIPVHLLGGLALLAVSTADGRPLCSPLSALALLLGCICRPEIRTT